MTEKLQTHVRVNSDTLFAVLRVLEEALPLVEGAVFEDDLLDEEDRRYWASDLERVQILLRVVNPVHAPTSWIMKPYVHGEESLPYVGFAHV